MLNTGAHVKIGTYEYVVAEMVENAYVHRFRNKPIIQQGVIPGEDPNKRVTEPEEGKSKLLYTFTDWTSGEGYRTFDRDDPATYDYSYNINSRLKGQLTVRPTRTTSTVTVATSDNNQRTYFAYADGALVLGYDTFIRLINETTGYDTWTAPTNPIATTRKITAMAGDNGNALYVASGTATKHELKKMASVSGAATVSTVLSDADGAKYIGLAYLKGKLYAWTGRKLFEILVEETGYPFTENGQKHYKVYDTGGELTSASYGGADPGSWWGDCIASQNSVIFMHGTHGVTQVYEFKGGRGYPLWRLPMGFTGKSVAVVNQILYVAGHWGGESSRLGYGAVYAMPLDSRRPVFVGFFQKTIGKSFQMQEACASYGDQVMFAAGKLGQIFVYDAGFNGISHLDSLGGSLGEHVPVATGWDTTTATPLTKIGSMATFGNSRFVAHYNPQGATGTSVYVHRYDDDEPNNRATEALASGAAIKLESPWFDFDYPMDVKALEGFHVTFRVEDTGTSSGLLANQRITVSYALDDGESPTFTSTTAIESTTAFSGALGRVFVPVVTGSSTTKFIRMRIRVRVDNNNTGGVKPPIVTGVTVQAELMAYQEEWEITLRTGDEPSANARGRSRKRPGNLIRTYLEDLAQDKVAVTFLDGYRDKRNNVYTTHVVTVQLLEDYIDRVGEGTTRLRLVARSE